MKIQGHSGCPAAGTDYMLKGDMTAVCAAFPTAALCFYTTCFFRTVPARFRRQPTGCMRNLNVAGTQSPPKRTFLPCRQTVRIIRLSSAGIGIMNVIWVNYWEKAELIKHMPWDGTQIKSEGKDHFMKKTIFVLGAGSGCGNHVAKKFGKEGFRVVLMARNPDHLAEYEQEFKDQGIDVVTRQVDASKPEEVTQVFQELRTQYGTPDVLFYNVGITTPDADITQEKNVGLLLERYMSDVGGAYHAIQQIADDKFSRRHGAVLVTGGGLALHPMYDYLPLSMDKAALRAMCLALYEELKKQHIYVGILTVTDVIASGEKCDPTLLAEDFWNMYTSRTECEHIH